MEHLTLYFRQGSSDKIYQASITPKDDGFVVQFSYGRRGSALATGTKTQAPVPYAQAKKIYDQLVASKIAKGYGPGEDGVPYQQMSEANRATGIHCQLLNPVEEDQLERLIADPAWWLQEKHDGRRLLLRKQGETVNYEGHAIEFRRDDGYLKLTRLCRAFGKKPSDFLRLKSTEKLQKAIV